MDTNSVKDMFDAMNKYGGSIMSIVFTSDSNPDEDRMIMIVQGREEIADIKAATDQIEEGWGE